jgi:hypothetical protein
MMSGWLNTANSSGLTAEIVQVSLSHRISNMRSLTVLPVQSEFIV